MALLGKRSRDLLRLRAVHTASASAYLFVVYWSACLFAVVARIVEAF